MRPRVLLTSLIVVIALCGGPATARSVGFALETVDTLRHAGHFPSLAFDGAGLPSISYQEGERLDLRFARFDGTQWLTQTLETALETGYLTSLAFGPDGEPRIAYDAVVNHRVMFARRIAGVWSIEEVSLNGHGFSATSSLAFDGTGRPCVLFTRAFQLVLACRDAGGWVSEVIDPAATTGWQGSLAFDALGRAHVSYGSLAASMLRYARKDGAVWTLETAAAGPIGGAASTSLAIAADGEPRVSYHDAIAGDLRCASRAGGVWASELVDSAGDVGRHSSLALDAAGEPWIAYLDRGNADLKLAHRELGAWVIEVVDSAARVGSHPSLRIAPDGTPTIAYADLGTGALKLARRLPGLAAERVLAAATREIPAVVSAGAAAHAPVPAAPVAPAAAAATQVVPTDFSDQLVASGLDEPTAFVFLPGDRKLVAQRRDGAIRLLQGGGFHAADPAGVIDSVRSAYQEQGLLGLALDPAFPARPYLYVHYDFSGALEIRIERYTLTGDLTGGSGGAVALDPASARMVLGGLPDSSGAHNGGQLAFDRDGMLIVALGDDGAKCASQDLASMRGKLLRVDVSAIPAGGGPAPALTSLVPADNPFASHPDPRARLVWQTGLRNPYSYSLDRQSGEAFIADVGQVVYEEVDHATAGGLDFGWPHYEGAVATTFHCVEADTSASVPPIAGYFYQPGPRTVIMGGIYRKPEFATGFPPGYEGNVFFMDFYTGEMRRIVRSGNSWTIAPPVPGQPSPAIWGNGFALTNAWTVGPDGAFWYLRLWSPFGTPFSGQLRRLASTSPLDAPEPATRTFELAVPRPSPARGGATVAWSQPRGARVWTDVLDAAGRIVRTLADGEWLASGVHERRWDARGRDGEPAAPGLYFVRVRIEGEGRRARALVLIR